MIKPHQQRQFNCIEEGEPITTPHPTHEQIEKLAYKLWQDYSAAGYDIASTVIWLEAESILTSYIIGTGEPTA